MEMNQTSEQPQINESELVPPQQEVKAEVVAPEVVEQKISAKQLPGTVGTPAEEIAKFAANYKFKANEKEHEIPEFMRGVIKDADSEKYVRKLFEKAYGLDGIKQRLEEGRTEFKTLKSEYSQITGQIDDLRQDYQRGDFDSFFKKLAIPEEKVLQWVLSKVEYSQMPPEQKQILDAKKQAEQRAWETQKTQRSMESQYQQQLVDAHQQMLDVTLERPDFQAAAQAYDMRKGQAGAFRSLVVKLGKAEASSGKHITPMEAVKAAIELVGGVESPKPTQSAEVSPAQPAPQPEANKKKTIPNLGSGKAASPAKSKMKSIDDLKRRYDELHAQ